MFERWKVIELPFSGYGLSTIDYGLFLLPAFGFLLPAQNRVVFVGVTINFQHFFHHASLRTIVKQSLHTQVDVFTRTYIASELFVRSRPT